MSFFSSLASVLSDVVDLDQHVPAKPATREPETPEGDSKIKKAEGAHEVLRDVKKGAPMASHAEPASVPTSSCLLERPFAHDMINFSCRSDSA